MLLMLRDGSRTMKELTAIPNFQTRKKRLLRMKEEGLVEIMTTYDGHKVVKIELTDLGKRIADTFSIVNALILPGKDIGDKSIDKRHFDPIVRLLHNEQPALQKTIRDGIGSCVPVINMLNQMISDGIVSLHRDDERLVKCWYSLTPLGEQIAAIYQSVYEDIVRKKSEKRR